MNKIECYTSEDDLEQEITEIYGTVEIAGLTFETGRILRHFDKPKFREMRNQTLYYRCGECGELYDEARADEADVCCIAEEVDEEPPTCPACGKERSLYEHDIYEGGLLVRFELHCVRCEHLIVEWEREEEEEE